MRDLKEITTYLLFVLMNYAYCSLRGFISEIVMQLGIELLERMSKFM